MFVVRCGEFAMYRASFKEFDYAGEARGKIVEPPSVLYVNDEHKRGERQQTGLYGGMIHPLCASISRSVPATSVEGFPCYRYAVYSRGSCLCSERSLIKWAILAISLLLQQLALKNYINIIKIMLRSLTAQHLSEQVCSLVIKKPLKHR